MLAFFPFVFLKALFGEGVEKERFIESRVELENSAVQRDGRQSRAENQTEWKQTVNIQEEIQTATSWVTSPKHRKHTLGLSWGKEEGFDELPPFGIPAPGVTSGQKTSRKRLDLGRLCVP